MTAIRKVAREIADRFQPEAVVLFGSYAYGRPRWDSDIDLLVVMPTKNERNQQTRIENAIKTPIWLDVHVKDPQGLRERIREGDWFLREITSQGKVLWGKLPGPRRAGNPVKGNGNIELDHVMKKLTMEWVEKAEEDWQVVCLPAQTKPSIYGPLCFHCQQTAEKYLKALLQEKGLPVPRTHKLVNLFELLLPHVPRGLRSGLATLTKYAVEYRYPQDKPLPPITLNHFRFAKRTSGKVRDTIRAILGISKAKKPLPTPRKKP